MKNYGVLFILLFLTTISTAQTVWYPVPSNTSKKLNTIDFPSTQVGYIGGNDSLLLKTVDGGVNWNLLPFSGVTFYPGSEHIVNIKFVSETVGFMAVGPYSGTYKTIDGGTTWAPLVLSNGLCFNQGLFFFDANNGFIGGSGCFSGEMIDKMSASVISGTTINTAGMSSSEMVVDIDFLDANFGLAASTSGRILRTTNGGTTWDTIPSSLPAGVPLTSVAILSNNLAFAGYNDLGNGLGVLMSTDGGLTWGFDGGSASFFFPAYRCLHETQGGKLYSGAQPSAAADGLIFERFTNGSWSYATVDHPINSIASYNEIAFGVGDSGLIVVNHPVNALGFTDGTAVPQGIELYPNPVQTLLHLDFLSEQSNTNGLKIYSIDGNPILEIEKGENTVNVSALSVGIYFVEVLNCESCKPLRFVKE